MLCPHDMARYVGSGLGDNEAEASGKALMRNTQLPTVGEGDCFFCRHCFPDLLPT